MMKKLTYLTIMGALLVGFSVLPVQAEMMQVSDEDLAQISGKANVINSFSSFTVANTATGDGNAQVGVYQWFDNHQTDASNQKGANFFSSGAGNGNQAQENVVAAFNAITWGASVDNAAIMGAAGGTVTDVAQSTESYASLYIGGF